MTRRYIKKNHYYLHTLSLKTLFRFYFITLFYFLQRPCFFFLNLEDIYFLLRVLSKYFWSSKNTSREVLRKFSRTSGIPLYVVSYLILL